jgi:membrane protein DedA with SNARE-associated domain
MPHAIFDMLRMAVVHYGYWAVAVVLLLENIGLPLPGETVLLIASFSAFSQRELQLSWIIIVATVVTTIGGSLGFALGQYGGRPLLESYSRLFRISPAALTRGENLFGRYGGLTIFFARFVFGIRVVAGPLAGVLRMPWRTFLIFNFLGAAAWVSVISSAGYLFGQHLHRLERVLKRFDLAILVLVIVVAAIWWWRSRHESKQNHPETEHPGS